MVRMWECVACGGEYSLTAQRTQRASVSSKSRASAREDSDRIAAIAGLMRLISASTRSSLSYNSLSSKNLTLVHEHEAVSRLRRFFACTGLGQELRRLRIMYSFCLDQLIGRALAIVYTFMLARTLLTSRDCSWSFKPGERKIGLCANRRLEPCQ